MNKPKKISLPEFKKKVVKIFIHGFLHLKGFDHKKNNDFDKMQKEERKIFRKKNKPTDILSFPIKKSIDNKFFYLGDIIISFEFINRPKTIKLLEFKKKL